MEFNSWEAPTSLWADDPYQSSGNSWYTVLTEETDHDDGFHCAVCGVTKYSIEAYQEHVVSADHVKLAAQTFNYNVDKKEPKDANIFFCKLCEINCTGQKAFDAHMVGAKHRKKEKSKTVEETKIAAAKLAVEPKEVRPIIRKGGEELPSMAMGDIANSTEALIGIELVVEVQLCEGEPPHFFCGACDAGFSDNQKIPHLIGVKHRLRVLKQMDYEYAKKIQASCGRRSALTKRLQSIAENMQRAEGRGHFKVITEAEYMSWKGMPETSGPGGTHAMVKDRPILNSFVASFSGNKKTDVYLASVKPFVNPTEEKYMGDHTEYFHPGTPRVPKPNKEETEDSSSKKSNVAPWMREVITSKTTKKTTYEKRYFSHHTPKDTSPVRKKSPLRYSGHYVNKFVDRSDRDYRSRSSSPHSPDRLQERTPSPDRRRGRTSVRIRTHSRDRSVSVEKFEKDERYPHQSDSRGPREKSCPANDQPSREETQKEPLSTSVGCVSKENENIIRKSINSTPPATQSKNPGLKIPPPPPPMSNDAKVMQLLGDLGKYSITISNETEAALIFNVSNALTEALLKYRLRNNSNEAIQKFRSENQSIVKSLVAPMTSSTPKPTLATATITNPNISASSVSASNIVQQTSQRVVSSVTTFMSSIPPLSESSSNLHTLNKIMQKHKQKETPPAVTSSLAEAQKLVNTNLLPPALRRMLQETTEKKGGF